MEFLKKILLGVVLILLGIIVALRFGFVPVPVELSGTGSMYPTFPKGQGLTDKERAQEVVARPQMFPYPNGIPFGSKRLFGYTIERGDIVDFENDTTRSITQKLYEEPSGFVKRVVAIPGDTIELRDGTVFLNNKPLLEPYIAGPHTTFGGEFLPDCTKLTIPQGSLFVMGDNRKGSVDSRRDVGLLAIGDVRYILPFAKQKGIYDKNFRNTQKDLEDTTRIKLNTQAYIDRLNEEREKAGVAALIYEPKLEASAQKRGVVMLKFNDLSFEATRSGYTMREAMIDVNYSNIVIGEVPALGYYEDTELVEYFLESPKSKEFFLNPDMQKIGIAQVQGDINGCPAHIIVQHFAGYKPPQYTKEHIDSWRKALESLTAITSGWRDVKNSTKFYEENKKDVDRINEIIAIRTQRTRAIVTRMENNEWLTNEEERYIDEDEALGKEQNNIAEKLNNR